MLRFKATECGSKLDHGSIICGASNSKDKNAEWHSFIFMRAVDDENDDGPYFELDDQSQGFHNIVESVVLSGQTVSIAIAPPKGRSFGHRLIIAELACSKTQVDRFRKGLLAVFRGQTWRVRND